MNARILGGLVGAAALGYAAVTFLVPSSDPTYPAAGQSAGAPSIAPPLASPVAAGGEPAFPRGGAAQYAISIAELQGFPPDAVPGSLMDLWVSWEPPITPRPRVQKLLDDVLLDKVVPSIDPNSPPTAIFVLDPRDIPDLLYGDRYGALSVSSQH